MSDLLLKLLEYDVIIFDLDNTIYNQDKYDFYLYCDYFNDELIAERLLNLKKEKGYGYKHLYDDFKRNEKLNLDIIDMLRFYRTNIPRNKEHLSLKNELAILTKNEKEVFLITNGYTSTQENKITYLGIANYFKKIMILDPDKTIPLKPDPKAFYLLNIDHNKKIVYVGDNLEIDASFAKNCGIEFIHYEFH